MKMIQDKLRQKKLQWFGHVRREGRRSVEISGRNGSVEGKRKVGRPWKT